ncbi:MAG: carboxymuconolactone decarboxylase family protein [Geobacteraceae bacterium]|nr:carboxymuconolactone decarboxylase family protein [Geobacteraceae bacterium]
MEMNETIRELIAVGASINANCQPSLQIHIDKALKSGARQQDVDIAIGIGNRVRKGAVSKMDEYCGNQHSEAAPLREGAVMEGGDYQFLGP